MPFITIPYVRGPAVDVAYIAMSAPKQKSSGTVSLAFSMSGVLAEQMQWNGDTRLNILEGIEDDAGIMMFEALPSGNIAGYKVYAANEGKTISVKLSPSRLKNYIIDVEHAEYTIIEHTADKAAGILLKMPTWMIYTGPVAKPKMQLILPPQQRRK